MAYDTPKRSGKDSKVVQPPMERSKDNYVRPAWNVHRRR